ncbi:MAG: serine/threonine protein kinase, partial [Clostridia bacterium]|nr:serine/threonine protein kinase [Clostridia bacterium]
MEIMTVNGKEYKIVKLLGKGKGGYSYLASNGEQDFVLKQIHHEPCSYYSFGNKIEAELNDYKRLSDVGVRIPKMIDVDVENERILKEYIEGGTIYDYVLNDRNVDLYIEQVKEMCHVLYPNNLNIDYFP